MSGTFMRFLVALASGLIFGAGLTVSGMTNPAKVRSFLDLAGAWDPSLAFVLAGAVITTFVGYRLLRRKAAPWCDECFHLPAAARIDGKLLIGSALFGVGWGMIGLCPGPAIVDLSTGSGPVALFVAAMLAGMALHAFITSREHHHE